MAPARAHRWLVAAAAALSFGVLARLPARGAEAAERPIAVVDLHVDLPYQHVFRGRRFARGTGQFPASRLARAGVIGVVLPLFVPASVSPTGPRLEDLEHSYQSVVAAIRQTPVFASPGCRASSGAVRTFLAFEGSAPLAGNAEALTLWQARGLRSVGLVHTRKNALATSSGDPDPTPEGLTDAGVALVTRAARLGLPIDVSHASDRATRDVLALAEREHAVVIATHSNARALADVPRNLRDEEIRGIARTGGVIGVNFHGPFLARGRRATLADVVHHIEYLVHLVGDEHVALGSDFEGDIRPPDELASVSALPRLAHALEARGLSRASVSRIFARNALRVLCAEH